MVNKSPSFFIWDELIVFNNGESNFVMALVILWVALSMLEMKGRIEVLFLWAFDRRYKVGILGDICCPGFITIYMLYRFVKYVYFFFVLYHSCFFFLYVMIL